MYVVGSVLGVELCVDGPRFAAFPPVDGEKPAATRGRFGAGMNQSQVTVPHDSQHRFIPLLDKLTRL